MNILSIGDIHFGKINNEEEMYNALKKYFIGYADKVKPELIVICGDSYDSRVFTNSNANIYMNKFIDDCRNTGAIIIILEGTEAHDRHQINALSHYVSDKFFIVNTVTKLNVLGLNLLILPEEYVRNDNYYTEYLDDKYDFIFGHGMSSHVGFSGGSSDEIMVKPYVWKAKDLANICKYYTVFGHIHTHSEYNNFIYTGSFSRLNFGEMEAKGFIHLKLEKNKCSYEFIENKSAPKFTDVYESKLPDDVDSLLNNLRGYQEHNDYLRIIVDQSDDSKYNTIKGFVQTHRNCTIKRIVDTSEKKIEKIAEDIKEKQAILHDKLSKYKNLSFMEITQKIAKDDYHVDITKEDINSVLNSKD